MDAGGLFQSWDKCLSTDKIPTLRCVPVVFHNIISAALVFSGVVALFFLIFSGIKFITSGGDPKQAEAAKKTLTYAIIGLVLVLSSFFIINFIGFLTQTPCINQFGFENCK